MHITNRNIFIVKEANGSGIMNIGRYKKDEFDGIISISSDIRKNKHALIGKFDVKDIVFIGIAVVAWLILSMIFIIFANEDMIPIYTIILLAVILPIMYIGFKKKLDMPMLDYMLMKNKSSNKRSRSQIDIGKSISNKTTNKKYIVSLEIIGNSVFVDDDKLIENKIEDLKALFDVKRIQVVYSEHLFLNLEVILDDEFCIIPIYNYFKQENNKKKVKIRSIDEILDFDSKLIVNNDSKKKKLYKCSNDSTKDADITKVFKIMLYKGNVDYNYIMHVRELGMIIQYVEEKAYNTFIIIKGNKQDIIENVMKLEAISKNYYIVIEELLEGRFIHDAISISMNNRY